MSTPMPDPTPDAAPADRIELSNGWSIKPDNLKFQWMVLTPNGYRVGSFWGEESARAFVAAMNGGVPVGWKLVPIHPTPAMRVTGGKVLEGVNLRNAKGCVDFADQVYAEMLRLAPAPPTTAPAQPGPERAGGDHAP